MGSEKLHSQSLRGPVLLINLGGKQIAIISPQPIVQNFDKIAGCRLFLLMSLCTHAYVDKCNN